MLQTRSQQHIEPQVSTTKQLCLFSLYLLPFLKLLSWGKSKWPADSKLSSPISMTRIKPCPSSSFPTDTHKFKHVPVKDIVVGEALAVEEVAEELPQV